MSIYANDNKFCRLSLMGFQETEVGLENPVDASANWYLGLCMILVSAILKFNWFGPWLSIFATTGLLDRHWTPPKNPSRKRIMQADSSLWADALLGGRLVYEEGRRPRRCPFGCRGFDLSDRVYHCSTTKSCLPMYDHYCDYLQSTVYLRTMKQYIFVLVFLPLDTIYSIAVSVAALCIPSARMTIPFVASIICCCPAIAFVVLSNTFKGLKRLVLDNTVAPELSGEQWTLAFKYRERGGWRLKLHEFEKNPWDIGPRENFRQVFGKHWWMWPFFWRSPERVYRYGNYVDRDLPFADFVMAEFTNEIMERETLSSVVIDPLTPSSIHGEGSRRQSVRSNADRRSQQRSSGASTSHVEALSQPRRSARQRTQDHS